MVVGSRKACRLSTNRSFESLLVLFKAVLFHSCSFTNSVVLFWLLLRKHFFLPLAALLQMSHVTVLCELDTKATGQTEELRRKAYAEVSVEICREAIAS